MSDQGQVEWTFVDVGHGVTVIKNDEITITVNSDFSGDVTNEITGDFFAFQDLKDLIQAGKEVEKMLIERYGGAS